MSLRDRAEICLLEAGFQKHESRSRHGSYDSPFSFDNGLSVRPRIVVEWDANLSMGIGLGCPAARSSSPRGKCWRVIVRHGFYDRELAGEALTILQAAKIACAEKAKHGRLTA